jgi:hypothetical protein
MGKLTISAKCSDLCWAEFIDEDGNRTESDGYVPRDVGIGGGDYVELTIDTATGLIEGWEQMSDRQFALAIKYQK